MIERIEYHESVLYFLRMHPDAGEARAVIVGLQQGRLPPYAVTDLDESGAAEALLPETGRFIRWHYEGERREVLVVDKIEYDE